MKKIKKYIKRNIKVVIAFLLGGIIIGTGGVYAATVLSSLSVSYSNTSSGLTSTNVQDAIDELTIKARNTNSKNNIVVAYTYNSSTCVTGDEATCEVNTCYKTKIANSCQQGTIIKYRVNDNEIKVFYVLHDDGATITMQQRENIDYQISWYDVASDNTKGPITALEKLEEATSTWSNVNSQTYTMGTTNFYQNAYTGCSEYNKCTTNTYTLGQRTAKARLITLQEASSTGCLPTNEDRSTDGSCPKWMHNYLDTSTSYGGTVDENKNAKNSGYWTMQAHSLKPYHAWYITNYGTVNHVVNVTLDLYGIRPVIVINK